MSVLCVTVVLLIYLLFPGCYSRQDDVLSTIRSNQIESIVENSCLLLGLQPLPQTLHSLLSNLATAYVNDSNVYVALLDHRDSQTYSSIKWTKESRDTASQNFAFFPKKVVDRYCLLVPSQVPQAETYPGPLSASSLVQFLNERCGAFRTLSGGVSPAGALHEHIMSHLYHIPAHGSTTCLTLKTLPTKEEFFWNYLTRSQPVVFEGAAKSWPAMKKWSMEYLEQRYGDKEVHIKMTRDGCYEGVESASLWPGYSEHWIPQEVRNQLQFPDLVVVRPATAEVKFSEFLKLVSAGLNHTKLSAYLEYSSIPYYMPELENDIHELLIVRSLLETRHLNMWLSDGNTLGKLHFDPYDNMLCQISGKKHVILFDPHNNENLYEAHIPEALLGYKSTLDSGKHISLGGKFYRQQLLESTSMVMSPVDILNPDLNRFPLFSRARQLECSLSPGDVLFMPAFWWHEVQSEPDASENRNLAVNYWYEPILTKEFPCSTCRLHYNTDHYRHLLEDPPTSP